MKFRKFSWIAVIGILTATGCGMNSNTPVANSAPQPAASVGAPIPLKSGEVWQPVANNLIVPRETIEIGNTDMSPVYATIYISQSGSLLTGKLKMMNRQSLHTIQFSGAISEPGLFSNTSYPMQVTIDDINRTTIHVDQTVKGDLLDTFANQVFQLTPGS